jgi:hypothetical protein
MPERRQFFSRRNTEICFSEEQLEAGVQREILSAMSTHGKFVLFLALNTSPISTLVECYPISEETHGKEGFNKRFGQVIPVQICLPQ